MTYTAVIGICVVSAAAVLFIKKFLPEYSLIASAAAGCVILLLLVGDISGLFSDLEEIFGATGLDGSVFRLVLKALSICYITGFAADLCKDFGQTSMAAKVELAGKIAIVTLTMPLIKQILNAALELIG